MRKTVFIFLMLFQAMFISAQSLTVTGSTTISTFDPCLQTHSYLTVKNISNKEHDILCEKNVISQPLGMENYFCWGGNCYGSSTIVSSSTLTLGSGQADNVSFGGYFDAYCVTGIGIVEYCFYPDNDSLDRSCITITYNETPTSILENNGIYIGEFYPTPSRGIVNFDYDLNTSAELVVKDILGHEILNIKLGNKGTQKINITNLSKGIYFGNIIASNKLVAIKKIIIE